MAQVFDEINKQLVDREADFPNGLLKTREQLLAIAEKKDDNEGAAYSKLSETLFWLGEYSESNDDIEKYFSEGVEYGKKAVQLEPESVAANMWYAACMGSHGTHRGIMSSLFYMKPIENHGKKSMKIDEDYFHGAALRLMGRYFHQAPAWPVGAGDNKKAIQYLEKAVERHPDFAHNQIYLAEAYITKKRKAEAKKLIDDVLAMPEPEMYKMHHKLVQAEASAVAVKL